MRRLTGALALPSMHAGLGLPCNYPKCTLHLPEHSMNVASQQHSSCWVPLLPWDFCLLVRSLHIGVLFPACLLCCSFAAR
jgi:hypothetical protein